MFDQNDPSQQTQDATAAPAADGIAPSTAQVTDPGLSTPDLSAPLPPSAPLPEPTTAPAEPTADPVVNFSTPALPPTDLSAPVAPSAPEPVMATPSAPAPVSDGLLAIKQGALQDLTPLLDHLDQSPEEKFRTTMMMIQASDDQSLVQTAYDAAKSITDEKVRAQALLDVVNEINYFTQQAKASAN